MSNIPPDPPDPPSTSNEIINQRNRDPDQSHSSARRGRNGRGDRGRNTGRPSKRAGHDSNTQTDQRNRSGEKNRPRQSARNPTIVKQATMPGEVSSSQADGQGQAIDHDRPANSSTATTSKSRHRSKDNSSRRGQFGARLTHSAHTMSSTRSKSPPPDSDLTTRLIHSLKTPPYPDCPICFNPLHPAQPIWSCSLGSDVSSCCWTPFHLKCIKDWAKKSVKDVRDALQTRGVTDELEYWRCPGCQTKRNNVPRGYLCFCGSVTDPKPGVSTPHSCGASCTRRRMACDHPCPLSCHPGPCPPCNLTVYVKCHCGKVTNAVRCENSHPTDQTINSCGAVCGRLLRCQIHSCNRPCHPGDCGDCDKFEDITCFCGQTTKEVQCGSGLELAREAYVLDAKQGEVRWSGRFDCGNTCGRAFDCGSHFCSKRCHVPSPTPLACPFDPQRVTTCPCGKQLLSDISDTQRTKCTDAIPSCQSVCDKRLEGCLHTCAETCHTSSCPPCKVLTKVPCRCGLTVRQILCHERQKEELEQQDPFLCDKVCGALRLCGRHQCSRICCPLGSVSRSKPNKSKKKGPSQRPEDHWEDSERIWHTCDLVCGKFLSCGLHRCTEADHRGLCPPCLQSSFEEMICHCGQTIIEPPVPCGTVISCTYPCIRPPPQCGHDKAPHHCHDDSVPCPPCPFLTSKLCSCGKMNVNNVRCSQETVLCGQLCGKLLDCGFHKCKRSCHGDACGPCPSICGKPRKLCHPDNHPCTLPCHAPSICNESEPCTATVTVTCPCGRFQQPTKCGKSFSNPNRNAPQLQCRDECAIAKRNAKLAEALGISPDRKEKPNVTYSDELVAFAKANLKFLAAVENTLNEFVNSDRKSQILPYTPENRRKFVRELCHLYRTDTQLIDPEPRRSIQIFRRIDTRIPTPLLTAVVNQSASGSANLGKLADLRTISSRPASAPFNQPSSSRLAGPSATMNRGWTSVVAAPNQGNMSSSTKAIGTETAPKLEITVPKQENTDKPLNSSVRDNWESD